MRQKQDNTKDVREEQEHLADFMGDIGNFDLPDLDLNLVDFLPSDETEETRYTLPKVVPMKEDFVMYDFYDDHFSRILDKYATICKPIRNSKAWDLFTRMTFNDKS